MTSHLRLLRLGGRALERRQDELVSLLTSQLPLGDVHARPAALGDRRRAVARGAVGVHRRAAVPRASWPARAHARRSALLHRLDGFAQLHDLRAPREGERTPSSNATIDKLVAIRDHVAQRGLLDVCVAASGKEAIDALLPSLERSLGQRRRTAARPRERCPTA